MYNQQIQYIYTYKDIYYYILNMCTVFSIPEIWLTKTGIALVTQSAIQFSWVMEEVQMKSFGLSQTYV